MYEFCVFAGTTEGREITELLAEGGAAVTAFVATEYGESLIKPKGSLTVTAGRLDEADMEKVFTDKRFDLVIDATHPYA
ncbi:MAG: precorrin-6A/cobalt-precorrin-6A reductase, partial [Oscillospiraceae bacterium]|nr:precorrin-6A/cobalt-precorrin-6A reductase [Oscillospiraceae bacterium]